MTFNELHGEYMKMCDKQECDDCKYNGNFPCQLSYGYDKGKADAIDEFKKDIIDKINFEDKWLLACKSNNADTNIMFSALRNFVNNRSEQLKEKNK